MAPCPPTSPTRARYAKVSLRPTLSTASSPCPASSSAPPRYPPASGFLSRGRSNREHRDRQGETLFIDARQLGPPGRPRQPRPLRRGHRPRRQHVPRLARQGGPGRVRRHPRLLQERRPRGDPQAWPCPHPRPLCRRRTASRRRRPLCGEDGAVHRPMAGATGGVAEAGRRN